VQSADAVGLRYVRGDGPGITRRRKGHGFAYYSASQELIRDPATLKRIRSLVIPPAWTAVWISPRGNTHLQAVGRDAKGRKQYRYHSEYRQTRNDTKFDKLWAFGAVLPRIRKQVLQDLEAPGFPKRKVVAAIVRLLDETCIRVGNEEYARTNGSYGLTTLQNKHATIRGDRMSFRFHGKSGQEHEIELLDAKVAKIVKRLQHLPGEALFEYRSGAGDYSPVDSGDVNEYLREIAGQDFTAKDFRTWHGSACALRELMKLGPPPNETAAKRNIVAVVKLTAGLLGNRPATCRNYYIHPSIIQGYSDGSLFERLPRLHSNRHNRELRPEEASLLTFIGSASNQEQRIA